MVAAIASFRLREVGSVSNGSAPVRVGLPLPRGVAQPGTFHVELDGVPLDADIETVSTWDDGSTALAIAHFTVPFAANGTSTLTVVDGRRKLRRMFHADPQLFTALQFRVEVEDVAGTTWSCSLEGDDAAFEALRMLVESGGSSPVVREVEVDLPLVTALGTEHPNLRCRVLARAWSRCPSAWLRLMVENCDIQRGVAPVPFARAQVWIGGRLYDGPRPGTHLAGQRWRRSAFVGEPASRVELMLTAEQAEQLSIVPKLTATKCSPVEADKFAAQLRRETGTVGGRARGDGIAAPGDPDGGPLDVFPIYRRASGTGDRHDIGPVPTWSLAFLQGGDDSAVDLQRWTDVNGSGAFPIHFRDGALGPMYLAHNRGPWSGRIPSVGSADPEPDIAHHARAGLLSWLCAADSDAADELAAWACRAIRENYPNDGTLQNMGDRREAWALYTLAFAARFLPDEHAARDAAKSCLERTSTEWARMIGSVAVAHPLGNLNPGDSTPSGRAYSKFTRVFSPWMQAWFVSACIVAEDLVGAPLFADVIAHGWKWFAHYADPADTFAHQCGAVALFDAADRGRLAPNRSSLSALVSYSAPVAIYAPRWTANGWSETPGTVKPIDTVAALRWWARITQDHSGYPLKAGDVPAEPDPMLAVPTASVDGVPVWNPADGEDYHEYGPGRVGLFHLAVKRGLPLAVEASTIARPEVARGAAKRPPWAATE